jgi:hypothetical protein
VRSISWGAQVSSQPDPAGAGGSPAWAADPVPVHVAEYQALRQEVNNRQTISNALIAADLTAFGVGVSATHQYTGVVVALAVVSSLIWLFWLMQTMQIYRIAAYVALELRPRLVSLCRSDLLGWESYVRRLTQDRNTAAMALFNRPYEKGMKRIARNVDGVYVSMLLGGATPLILAAIALADYHQKGSELLWRIAFVSSLLLWAYALYKAVTVMRSTRIISRRIIDARDPAGTGEGWPQAADDDAASC